MGKLGDTLRDRRTFLGISLDQAEEATKIRRRLLQALENGEYDMLPASGYVRGYVSSYGRYLELETQPLLAMYSAETGTGHAVKLDLIQTDEAVPRRGEQHALPWRVIAIAIAIVVVALLAIWGINRINTRPEPTVPIPVTPSAPSESPAGEASPTTSEQGTTPAPEESDTGKQNSGGADVGSSAPFTVVVSVEADGASWIEVDIDGKSAYKGTMTGGQSKTFEVAGSIFIKSGKPEVVTVTRDGEPVTFEPSSGLGTIELSSESPAP